MPSLADIEDAFATALLDRTVAVPPSLAAQRDSEPRPDGKRFVSIAPVYQLGRHSAFPIPLQEPQCLLRHVTARP